MTAGFNSEQPAVKVKVKIKLRLLIRCVELWMRWNLTQIILDRHGSYLINMKIQPTNCRQFNDCLHSVSCDFIQYSLSQL